MGADLGDVFELGSLGDAEAVLLTHGVLAVDEDRGVLGEEIVDIAHGPRNGVLEGDHPERRVAGRDRLEDRLRREWRNGGGRGGGGRGFGLRGWGKVMGRRER